MIKKDEVIDDLQRDGLRIIQNNEAFKFGIDAVLLSHFVKTKRNAVIYDLGTGTGIIPILLSAITQAKRIVGIEIQTEMVEMARRSVLMNHLEEKIEIMGMDIKSALSILGKSSADVVVSNPPYFKAEGAIKNPNSAKAIARHEVLLTLDELVASSAQMLKPGGNLFMIHRPNRLVDLVDAMRRNNLEPKEIQFVFPNKLKAPNLFLIRANRGGKPDLKFLNPLFVYDENGDYSEEIYAIYNASQIDVFARKEE